jgi:hypothetical protein
MQNIELRCSLRWIPDLHAPQPVRSVEEDESGSLLIVPEQ